MQKGAPYSLIVLLCLVLIVRNEWDVLLESLFFFFTYSVFHLRECIEKKDKHENNEEKLDAADYQKVLEEVSAQTCGLSFSPNYL